MWVCLAGAGFYFMAVKAGLSPFLSAALVCGVSLSPPASFYTHQAYPETLFSLALTASVLLLLAPTPLRVILAGILACTSPWFSDRAIFPALILFAGAVWLSPDRRTWGCVAMIGVLSALGLATYYHQRFGVPWPIHSSRMESWLFCLIAAGGWCGSFRQ